MPLPPTACSETAIWQLPILPSVPEYWRLTPGERLPSLGTPVSSSTHAAGSITAHTRSATARSTTSGSHGLSARKCCSASYSTAPPPSRATIGSSDLRAPASINPRAYSSALRRCSDRTSPDATSAKYAARRSLTSGATPTSSSSIPISITPAATMTARFAASAT